MVKSSLRSKIPIVLLGVALVGCSSPSSQTTGPDVLVVASEPENNKVVSPAIRSGHAPKPRPKSKPMPRASSPTEGSVTPKAPATFNQTQPPPAAEQPAVLSPIATFVTAGQLESADAGQLVFVGKNATAQEDQGLFEDAILLSRVRAGLAAVAEPALASTAKVSSGTVTLDVPANFEPQAIGAAVDTALNTTGVRKVQVTMTPD
jgi:hypothetical protein